MATMALAVSCSIEQPQLVKSPVEVAAQLVAPVRASDRPWLYSALTQVRDIERTGAQIPGLGDLRIGQATATRARLLLAMIEFIELPVPHVSPVSGGGMSIEWAVGPKEVKYALYPDGSTMFYQVQDDEITSDGILQTMMPNEVTGPLKWMLDVRP
jgi:hypothetical protein